MSNHTGTNDNVDPTSYYGYIPTFWICCTFITLFSLTTVIHLGQALFIKPNRYWLIPTAALCGIGEIIGWSGRLWSNKNPLSRDAFMMQIVTTMFSPVFLSAALYTILGIIISLLGEQYSRLKPKTYLKIFISADALSLLIQSAGGAMAATANTDSGSKLGSNIMLGGIFLQMVAMVAYTILAFEVIARFWMNRPISRKGSLTTSSSTSSIDIEGLKKEKILPNTQSPAIMSTRMKLLVLSLAITTILVFIRTFYRTAELAGGWNGHIIRTQIYFNLLDATPITLALFTLNILSPAILLRTSEV